MIVGYEAGALVGDFMFIAGLIGDDEHTAKDDAYVRAMKCRKWVVVAAALCFAVHADQFSPEPFSVHIGKVTIALASWRGIVLAGLAYSVAQYSLIMIQLAGRYSELLAQRFGLREAEKAVSAQNQQSRLVDELAILEGRASASASSATHSGYIFSNSDTGRELRNRRIEGVMKHIERLQEQIDAMPAHAKPSRSYRISEIAIDCLRLFVPYIAVVLALASVFKQ